MKTIGTLVFTLILSCFSAVAKVYDSDGSVANVRGLHDSAHDGDTITLPSGTFSWTQRINITKGITLQGATTIDGAGTSNPTVTDATIIKDNTPRSGSARGIIRITRTGSQLCRITGITFVPGDSTTMSSGGAIQCSSTSTVPATIRIDHCHLDQVYHSKEIWVSGWVYGVADHNVITVRGTTFPFMVEHRTWGGSSQIVGNGSWADYPWYGTDKFWFIETNTIIRVNATAAQSLVDCSLGGRWVARHNYLENVLPQGHGTEGGNYRGQRVNEFYDNICNITTSTGGGGQRGGTNMWHDNTFLGKEQHKLCGLANYRLTWIRTDPIWGLADGTSVWDRNDTEGNGTYVEGHPPFLFDSGRDTSSVHSQGVIHDSTKHWVTNQWVGYSVRNLNPAVNLAGYIISNTSNTITYFWGATVGNRKMIFNAGDPYQIHRVLTVMDGCGMGKGDQVTGNPPINAAVGRPFWTHEATEPCYSWNNVYSPNGHVLGIKSVSSIGTLPPRENIEYFNLGGGFPANTTPSQVRSRYVAALNGVDYTGTFVYQHPLVTGEPTPAPGATSRTQQHLQKKKKNSKKPKRRNWPKIGE